MRYFSVLLTVLVEWDFWFALADRRAEHQLELNASYWGNRVPDSWVVR